MFTSINLYSTGCDHNVTSVFANDSCQSGFWLPMLGLWFYRHGDPVVCGFVCCCVGVGLTPGGLWTLLYQLFFVLFWGKVPSVLVGHGVITLFTLPFVTDTATSRLSVNTNTTCGRSPCHNCGGGAGTVPLVDCRNSSFCIHRAALNFVLSRDRGGRLDLATS